MKGPYNDRYTRRFRDPRRWPSNGPAFANWAVEMTRQRVNELSWELYGEQVAEEFVPSLKAEAARVARQRAVRSEDLHGGEPGE